MENLKDSEEIETYKDYITARDDCLNLLKELVPRDETVAAQHIRRVDYFEKQFLKAHEIQKDRLIQDKFLIGVAMESIRDRVKELREEENDGKTNGI